MIASRWTTNSCCRQPLPLLPGRRSRPSIFSVAAMVAGDNDGLPWRRAGRQWLRLPVGIKKGGKYSPQAFLSVMNTTWAKITPILPMLPHHTPSALCGSVEKNTDSLVKGMILFDQGGGGRGGEGRGDKVMVESAPPRQSMVRLFPVVVCARDCKCFFLIFSRAQKYWRETHMLDPLAPGPVQHGRI
jgi:hypothetical protein